MEYNYHYNIFTNGQTYKFNLITMSDNLSSGYKIVSLHEEDLPIIQQFLENAQRDGALTVDTLANRLRNLPVDSYTKMTNLVSTHFPQSKRVRSVEKREVSEYLSSLPRDKEDAIDLSRLIKLPGGGTHDIYKSEENPLFFMKVMRNTVGNPTDKLKENLAELTHKYNELYQIFGTSRCLIETRFIDSVKEKDWPTAKESIVSVVKYDTCFQSEEKFGFNTDALEKDGVKITDNLSQYHEMNSFLMGAEKATKGFDIENYLVFQESFRPIFKLLDDDENLRELMLDFLTKFKEYYKKTNQLMDFIGKDNVLFYKTGSAWEYKVGSVIKHETGEATKTMLREITNNPSAVNESFKNWTLIFYVPSWIRALNATAKKLGMDRIIEDITLSKEDSQNLAHIHTKLPLNDRAVLFATHHKFKKAMQLFNQYKNTSSSHDTAIRDTLGTIYWCYIKNEHVKRPKDEIKAFIELLNDPRNEFPEYRWTEVRSAIEGLDAEFKKFESIDTDTEDRISNMLNRLK